MAVKVGKGRIVRITYRISDVEGRLMEERTPENPYEYMHGRGQIVGPVEQALEGKTAGFQTEVIVSPIEGYGEYDEALVAELPRAQFPPGVAVEVGMKFNTKGPGGQVMTVRVLEVDDGIVTVDGNHPLAGLDLIFDLKILDVREPTETEAVEGRPELMENEDAGSGETIH